jgi:hypothetical protein
MGYSYIRYLNAIQTGAPHLLRYLATAFIVNKRRRPQFKEFIKVVQQEQHSYKDPITEFLACVYVNYDFDGAQKKMKECEEVSFLYLNFPPKKKYFPYLEWLGLPNENVRIKILFSGVYLGLPAFFFFWIFLIF